MTLHAMTFDDRPFHLRRTYEECHRALAVCEDGELVRVVDWARVDPQTGRRVLVVKACDPAAPHRGLAWEAREDTLAPVARMEGAGEAARQWRAARMAEEIEQGTVRADAAGRRRRI